VTSKINVQLLNAAMQHQANCRARESTAAYTCLVLLNRAGPTGARQFNKKEAGIAKRSQIFCVNKKERGNQAVLRIIKSGFRSRLFDECRFESGSWFLVLKNLKFKGGKNALFLFRKIRYVYILLRPLQEERGEGGGGRAKKVDVKF
jgi:hypothetical protein